MNFRFYIAAACSLAVICVVVAGGFSFSFHLGSSQHQIAVQLSPLVLAAWPLALFAIVVSWKMKPTTTSREAAKWYRVLFSLFIDFALYLIVTTVPVCLLALWIESATIGQFAWEFSRNVARHTDILISVISIMTFMLLWAMLGIPMRTPRQSPGTLLTGIIIYLPEPVPSWRCAVFGVFKYFALAVPVFGDNFRKAGGFQAHATIYSMMHD